MEELISKILIVQGSLLKMILNVLLDSHIQNTQLKEIVMSSCSHYYEKVQNIDQFQSDIELKVLYYI